MLDRIGSSFVKKIKNFRDRIISPSAYEEPPLESGKIVDRTDISMDQSGREKKPRGIKGGVDKPSANKHTTAGKTDVMPLSSGSDIVQTQKGDEQVPLFFFEREKNGPAIMKPDSARQDLFDLEPFNREFLTLGKPFPGTEARMIERVSGAPLTAEGLRRIYEDCVPGVRMCIPIIKAFGENFFDYSISWLDNNGREVSHLDRKLLRHEDGSLELHSYNVWVDQEYRGRGTSARALLNEIKLLRTLSQHSDTRITLRAGHAYSNWKSLERLGAYTWANYGFGFSGGPPGGFEGNLMGYPARCKDDNVSLTGLQLMQRQFEKWLHKQADKGTVHPDLIDGIIELSREWKYPWQFSTFQLDGVKIPCTIGEKTVLCDIGKAFLTSEDAPLWDGAWYINRPMGDLQSVGLEYCKRTLDRAEIDIEAEQKCLSIELFSDDMDKKLGAIKKIAIQCNEKWLLPLSMAAERSGNEVQKAVEQAVQKIKGRDLEEGVKDTVCNREEPVIARISALLRLRSITGKPQVPLFQQLLKEPDDDTRLQAFSTLYWAEWYQNPQFVIQEALRLLPDIPPMEGNKTRQDLRRSVLSVLIMSNEPKNLQMAFESAHLKENSETIDHLKKFFLAIDSEKARKYATILSPKAVT